MTKRRKYITKKKSQKQRQKKIVVDFLLITGMLAALACGRYMLKKVPRGHESVAAADVISGNYQDSTVDADSTSGDYQDSTAVAAAGEESGAGTSAASNPPKADSADWRLTLVNPWNYLPEDYEVSLRTLDDGYQVDYRCAADLQNMLADCQAAGLCPVICSAYRTWEKQERLFQNKIQRLMSQGYSEEDARVEAAKVVAVPGTSEHQLGLAVDIVDAANQMLDESQEHTKVQKWLMENSWRYGFILRYPNGKSEITGIIYEPWHYRYVGREAAKEIYEQEVCLEEYLGRMQ